MEFQFDQLITVIFTLFAVIDIVGSIPLLIAMKEKLGKIKAKRSVGNINYMDRKKINKFAHDKKSLFSSVNLDKNKVPIITPEEIEKGLLSMINLASSLFFLGALMNTDVKLGYWGTLISLGTARADLGKKVKFTSPS